MMMKPLIQERLSVISARLAEHGRVLSSELAAEFHVSEDTIRRDLRELAAAGLCKRVYGGALPTATPKVHFNTRLTDNRDVKAALARAAIATLRPNMTVFLDSGTTNLAIAFALPKDLPLTVVTNAPTIAAAIIQTAQVNTTELITIGGNIPIAIGGAVGSRALRDIEAITFDIACLGACGIAPDTGITADYLEDAHFKQAVAARSRAVLVAATNDKLGTAAAHAVVPLDQCDFLCVEHDAQALGLYERPDLTILRAPDGLERSGQTKFDESITRPERSEDR
ncbi:DeoR/GlpR transcriptional regulator [Rhizobium sp. CFBP 8762]|nr:DeoR/GlpR transcriptional regulator [Rhizobium sp. CFBP 8762]